MLSVSGRSNYSTNQSKVAKHCNIRYLKDYNNGTQDSAAGDNNPYINIAETSPRGKFSDEKHNGTSGETTLQSNLMKQYKSEKRLLNSQLSASAVPNLKLD